MSLCSQFNNDEIFSRAIEFVGSEQTLEWRKIDRFTIVNMTTEWGALSGIFTLDNIIKDWILQKASVHGHDLEIAHIHVL